MFTTHNLFGSPDHMDHRMYLAQFRWFLISNIVFIVLQKVRLIHKSHQHTNQFLKHSYINEEYQKYLKCSEYFTLNH